MKSKIIMPILFWGACWGIAEATLGYVLHRAAIALPGIPGFLMFPFAFFFIYQCVRITGKPASAAGMAAVAAAIKLLDLFIPGNIPLRVINPAFSLLVEGLAVMLVCLFLKRKAKLWKFQHILASAVIWRLLFLVDMAVILQFGLPAGLITDGIWVTLRFVLLESLVNGVLIWILLKIPAVAADPKPTNISRNQPVLTFLLLILAIALQMIL